MFIILKECRSGGIGRHAILRGWWEIPVGVQIPPSAPYRIRQGRGEKANPLVFLTLNPNQKYVNPEA